MSSGINEIGAAVTQNRADVPDRGCLLCWFELVKVDERVRKWTGLSAESLNDTGRKLTDQDIAAAEIERRPWLKECQCQGKTVCSVITEAQLASRLGVAANDGFRPSVPFIASAAAALSVAALIKALYFPTAAAPSRFQIGNFFIGPESGMAIERSLNPQCLCVLHKDLISQTRTRHPQ